MPVAPTYVKPAHCGEVSHAAKYSVYVLGASTTSTSWPSVSAAHSTAYFTPDELICVSTVPAAQADAGIGGILEVADDSVLVAIEDDKEADTGADVMVLLPRVIGDGLMYGDAEGRALGVPLLIRLIGAEISVVADRTEEVAISGLVNSGGILESSGMERMGVGIERLALLVTGSLLAMLVETNVLDIVMDEKLMIVGTSGINIEVLLDVLKTPVNVAVELDAVELGGSMFEVGTVGTDMEAVVVLKRGTLGLKITVED